MSFPKTVKTVLVSQLRDDIVRGIFQPGERLRLEGLADRYGISITPLREAMSTLEAEGIITIQPHKGAVVTSFQADELLSIYEIRATLEKMATMKAAPLLTKANLEHLELLVDQMDVVKDDPARFSELNTQFHSSIYEPAAQKPLFDLIISLRYRTQHYLHDYTDDQKRLGMAQAEHRKLLNLFAKKNIEKASELMYEHVFKVGESIAKLLRNKELEVAA